MEISWRVLPRFSAYTSNSNQQLQMRGWGQPSHLSNLAYHSSIRDVDLRLITSPLMSFTAQELEVLAACSVLKLLDVGIVAELH